MSLSLPGADRMRPHAAAVALLAFVGPLSGCSLVFMKKAPGAVAAPDAPVECTSSVAAPILDAACTSLVVGTLALMALATMAPNDTGTSSSDPDAGIAPAVLAGLVVACPISMGVGWSRASRCRKVKAVNARCMSGELDACLTLAPGWSPPVATRTEAVSPPAPAPEPAVPRPEPSATRSAPPGDEGPRRRASLAVRTGYARAGGDLRIERRDFPPSQVPEDQVPVQLDLTYAWGTIPVGLYVSWAVGAAEVGRAGLQATYELRRPGSRLVPWAGAGLGFEWVGTTGGWHNGTEFLLQGGAQYRLGPWSSLGPYVQLSLVQIGGKDVDAGVHRWLYLGGRGTFGR